VKEFELISSFFADRGPKRKDVILGIGDDAALTKVPEDNLLVVATDTMVEDVHFFKDAPPRSIGHKCLAVNLSDFAAMGAEPAWASVAMTLPEASDEWLEEFTAGLFAIAEYYNVQIVGGDTTQGPLAITVSVKGFIKEDKALLRSGAKVGDWIYVTGQLGDAALTVANKLGQVDLDSNIATLSEQKFNYPSARIAAGHVLRHAATSAIDISDGLIQDLRHIIRASGVSAEVNLDNLPVSPSVNAALSEELALEMALIGGEDYELLFTVPEEKKAYLEQNSTAMGVGFHCIGQIKSGDTGIVLMKDSEKYPLPEKLGFEHFSGQNND
jgi:thiamine-monophosphate kinase